MTLTSKQRSIFRSQAHSLKPVVIIGSNGVTDAVLAEINRALNDHELIKVKIASQDREQRKVDALQICEALDAQLIQNIGNISIIYRKNPDA